MTRSETRRRFLTTATCSGGCLLAPALARRGLFGAEGDTKPYDFDKLTYCCYECKPEQCPLLKASLANDAEGKKEIIAKWREKYGRDFTPDEVFCFGCKVEPARQGFAVRNCDVRACVVEKKLVSCAHCRELADCKRQLWVNYPKFREKVLEIQKQVLA